MAEPNRELKPHEKKQASILISITGIVGFTVVEGISLLTSNPVPLYVLCIFAAITVPPELIKRLLRAFLGGKDD